MRSNREWIRENEMNDKFDELIGITIKLTEKALEFRGLNRDDYESHADSLDYMIILVYLELRWEHNRHKIKDKEIAQRLFEKGWKSQSRDGQEKPYSTRHIGGRRRYLQRLGKDVGKK